MKALTIDIINKSAKFIVHRAVFQSAIRRNYDEG